MSDQVSQVESYRASQRRKAERGAIPDPEDVADPSSWPYSDESGPPYTDPAAEPRQRASADDIALADFTIGPRETLCQECWLIHRPDVDCGQ